MTNYITQQGLLDLQAELKDLQEVRLPAVIKSLTEARADGDLSENAAYDSSKAMQDQLEMRISEVENVIVDYEIIEATTGKSSSVQLGSTVEVEYLNTPTKQNFTLTIVGSSEANAAVGKISNDSPLAHAIMGKKDGDEVSFLVHGGREMKVKIIKLS
jgi:transcription elongation factor GreA